MSAQTRLVQAAPETVWSVLADGWMYPLFVVGAARMRDVDESWPAVDACLHHSVGSWPWLIDDDTRVLEVEPLTRLKLLAHGWPAGAAEVEFRLHGKGLGTELTMQEDVVSGPGLLIPKPLLDRQLRWRNSETLRRLSYVAERRHPSPT